MRRTIVTRVIAALALATLAPVLLGAQEGAGRGRASVGVLQEPASTSVNQTVSLRIHPKSSEEAASFKDSLVRQQGVSEVKLSDDLRTVSCTYQGSYGDLPKLEAKSSGSLLSPARVVLSLTRDPAKAKCKTCGVEEHLRSIAGATAVMVKGIRAELYADLERLDVRKLAEAVESAGYQMEIQSHAWWIVRIEGGAAGLPEALAGIKGVLKVEGLGSDARVLALRAVPADVLVNAAQKAGLRASATLLRPGSP